MSNYPDNIHDFDHVPGSPFYEGETVKTYDVLIEATIKVKIEVEAENREDAQEIAQRDWTCSDMTEILECNVINVIEV